MKQKLQGWRWRQALETTVPPMEAAALSWAAKRTKMRSSQGAAILRKNLMIVIIRIRIIHPRSPGGEKYKVDRNLNRNGVSCYCKVNTPG